MIFILFLQCRVSKYRSLAAALAASVKKYVRNVHYVQHGVRGRQGRSGQARGSAAETGVEMGRKQWGGNNGAETMGGSRCMSTGYAGYSKSLIERISLLYWPPLPSLQLWSPGVR